MLGSPAMRSLRDYPAACGGCGKGLDLHELRIEMLFPDGKVELYHHVTASRGKCRPVLVAALGHKKLKPPEVPDMPPGGPIEFKLLLERYARALVVWALNLSKGNKSAACRLLNMRRTTFVAMLRRWPVRTKPHRAGCQCEQEERLYV